MSIQHVIAIGPQGGKIVGYHGGKPIYLGSPEAEKLVLKTPAGSPAHAAHEAGLQVGVHPTEHDTVAVSWSHTDPKAVAAAKAWLSAHGGAKALPPGTVPIKSSTHTILHVPRAWAEASKGGNKKPSGNSPEEIKSWLDDLPVGSVVKLAPNSHPLTKLDTGKWLSAGSGAFSLGWSSGWISTSGGTDPHVVTLGASPPMAPQAAPSAPGDAIKNGPADNTPAGIKSWLDSLPAGSQVKLEPAASPVTKQADGKWFAPGGGSVDSGLLSKMADGTPILVSEDKHSTESVTPTTKPGTKTPAEAGYHPVDKAALHVWGLKSWKGSARHPMVTPDGPGQLLGHVFVPLSGDKLTGDALVEVGGQQKAYSLSALTPVAGAPLQGPWAHPDVKVWHHPGVKAMMDKALAAPITDDEGNPQGAHTGKSVFDALGDAGIPCFLIGGMVRDAVQGKVGNDLDFAYQGTGAQALRQAAKSLGLPLATYSAAGQGNGSGLVEFGHDNKTVESGKLQGKGFGGYGTSHAPNPPPPPIRGGDAHSDAQSHDFACNALLYDHKNGTIIDPTGHGVADALSKTLRMTVPQAQWGHWLSSNPNNIGRYYKFRGRGYTPADAATEHLFKTAGKALVEAGKVPAFALMDMKKAKEAVIADFGEAWYNQHIGSKVGG